ncbi:NDP-hexose 2,3-dehydratase family protein [Streptomyces sp. MST-110588]|uniref:NDP-hexose 2,3-dehydratase family protein n=1 Tax=Streptomyces sp. MST-110588 TaxID=2833628 RepID=UPI001F5C7A51|nr:NDP-hexose 2,3-dehydratase family protein [Streptomyces sp. MST-110588]UNO40762.1 NDP-hexose 2,3-dehydratase family protein [Streptomyces sp. MST-110588]
MSIATSVPHSASDSDTARRFARSGRARDGVLCTNAEFDAWFARQRLANRFEVTPVPFSRLRGWRFRTDTGDLAHDSGGFFRIEGLRVTGDLGEWSQPVINQREIGVLGILVKEFDGVPHLLMQAKMEPGNVNTVQLSPTVQATRSNHSGVHGGRAVPYLEYFTDRTGSGSDDGSGDGSGSRALARSRTRVIADVLQSEQGAWFLRKRNRNMLVEVDQDEDVPAHPDFRWLTLGQVDRLLHRDNVVNMDARSVLACLPRLPDEPSPGAFGHALHQGLRPGSWSLHSDAEILHWITGQKARRQLTQERIPLSEVAPWRRDHATISHPTGRYFRVIAAEVTAGNREVPGWTQPLVEPAGPGVVAFLTRRVNGVLHVLLHARPEAGCTDVLELAPTVQYQPCNHPGRPPRFSREAAAGDRLVYDALQSEEGGRFMNAQNRYRIAELGEGHELEVPEDFMWVTPRQMTGLLRHGYYLNVQARSLFAALLSLA